MKKEAQKRIYSINEMGIQEMESWIDDIKTLWNKRLDKLEKYVLKMKQEKNREKK